MSKNNFETSSPAMSQVLRKNAPKIYRTQQYKQFIFKKKKCNLLSRNPPRKAKIAKVIVTGEETRLSV